MTWILSASLLYIFVLKSQLFSSSHGFTTAPVFSSLLSTRQSYYSLTPKIWPLKGQVSTDDITMIDDDEECAVDLAPVRAQVNKHLYRWFTDISVDCWIRTVEPKDFLLSCNYTEAEVDGWYKDYSDVFESLDAFHDLAPKVRFLVQTLGGGEGNLCDGTLYDDGAINGDNDDDFVPHDMVVSELGKSGVPPEFFGYRLERVLGPHHAYLEFHKDSLPHGKELLADNGKLLKEFLNASQSAADFADLCNRWSHLQESQQFEHWIHVEHEIFLRLTKLASDLNETATKNNEEITDNKQEIIRMKKEISIARDVLSDTSDSLKVLAQEHEEAARVVAMPPDLPIVHSKERVEAFERAFRGGLLAAAQNEISKDLKILGCTPSRMLDLLLEHGANPIEEDFEGNMYLHWAAGSGNLDGARSLMKVLLSSSWHGCANSTEILVDTVTAKDGATPLHWACCGVKGEKMGAGGHQEMCNYFLQEAGEEKATLANAVTYAGSTPLMWAAWAGNLDIVKTLLSNGADPKRKNQNGDTVVHCAAAGGNLELCKYLYEVVGVDFKEENKMGRSPLDNAICHGQGKVEEWIAPVFYSSGGRSIMIDQSVTAEREYIEYH